MNPPGEKKKKKGPRALIFKTEIALSLIKKERKKKKGALLFFCHGHSCNGSGLKAAVWQKTSPCRGSDRGLVPREIWVSFDQDRIPDCHLSMSEKW